MNNLSAYVNLRCINEDGKEFYTLRQTKSIAFLSYLIGQSLKPQLTHDQSYELAVTKFCNMIIGRSR